MENSNGLKNLYLTLFILGIVSCILGFFLGFFLSIAILVITLIIKSKLPKDTPSSGGLKVMFFSSITQISWYVFSFIFSILSGILFPDSLISVFFLFFNILVAFMLFVAYIIGTILIYKDYDKIN